MSIIFDPVKDDMEGRVLISAVGGEKPFVPLTDCQSALSVISDLEVVRGVEAMSVFGLDG